MNTYSEFVSHFTLEDGNYTQILKFCIDACVNLMVSFPDISIDEEGGFVPFDKKKSEEPGYTEKRIFFGSRIAGIEVTLRESVHKPESPSVTSDFISAESYGLNDKQSVYIISPRDAEETYFNRRVEIEITAPEEKAGTVMEMFRSLFGNKNPGNEKIQSVISSALLKVSEKRWSDAADDASYVLEYRPENSDALLVLGMADTVLGDWRNGKRKLLKTVEKLPASFPAWFYLGVAYRDGSDNGSALECFDRALVIDPGNHAAFYMKGVILEETGRDDEAVEAFRYALKYSSGTGINGEYGINDYSAQAVEALARLGRPWHGDEDLPLPEGCDAGEDLVHAAEEGDVRKIGKLLLRGASINHRSTDKNRHGRTPLIAAAVKGELHAVRYLLAHGADINTVDTGGCSALASALEWGDNRDAVMLLIKEGADVNSRDPYGRPVILNARSLGDAEILDAMVKAGADINSVDDDGANGIICAALCGTPEGARFFIDHGLDADSRDRNGRTPLMIAAEMNNIDLIKYLINCGADVSAADLNGRTPLMAAAEKTVHESLKLLIEAGADVNSRDKSGRSAMDILLDAGQRGNMESYRKCIDLLADAGAELIHEKGNRN